MTLDRRMRRHATALLAVALSVFTGIGPGGLTMPWGAASPSLAQLLGWVAGSVLLSPIFLGEEFGWRSYVQLKLWPRRPILATVVVGVMWGVWHYPFILAGGQPVESRGVPGRRVAAGVVGDLRGQTGRLPARARH